jgi:hypothetical protein
MNMRPGSNNNNNKRGRGRGRGKHHGGGGGGGGGGPRHQGGQQSQDQVFNIHRTIDSNGPDVKIRGNANHIYEKYLQLARDANSSGDRVMAENYLQHAEHYYRLIMAYQAHLQQQGQHQQGQQQQGQHQHGQQQHGQPYGGGQQHGGQPSQAGHYGGPYRNQPAAGQSEGGGNVYDQANGNGRGEAVVTAAGSSSSQDDAYNEENVGRYD